MRFVVNKWLRINKNIIYHAIKFRRPEAINNFNVLKVIRSV